MRITQGRICPMAFLHSQQCCWLISILIQQLSSCTRCVISVLHPKEALLWQTHSWTYPSLFVFFFMTSLEFSGRGWLWLCCCQFFMVLMLRRSKSAHWLWILTPSCSFHDGPVACSFFPQQSKPRWDFQDRWTSLCRDTPYLDGRSADHW